MSPTQESLQAPLSLPAIAPTFDPPIKPIVWDDLLLFADFLADEFEFQASAARLAEIAWYQDRVGADVCSLMQAAELRDLTVACCEDFAATVRLAVRLDERTPAAQAEAERMKLVEQGSAHLVPGEALLDRAMAEVGRPEVKDGPAQRARRARFFAGLPDRQIVPTVQSAEDREFEDRMERNTRWWAEREDGPPSLMDADDEPLLDPGDVSEVWGVTGTGIFWLACLGAGLWALARWVVGRG